MRLPLLSLLLSPMKPRPVALPLLLLQLLCVGVLLTGLFGRLLEVWETHVMEAEKINALTHLLMRLWMPGLLLLALIWLGLNLLQAAGGKQRVGSNVLWPIAATIFAYFLVAFGFILAMRVDKHAERTERVLQSVQEDRRAVYAYKKETPAFYNYAPHWFPLWIGLAVAAAGAAAATVSYVSAGHRGDMLEPEEERAGLGLGA